MKMRRKQKNFVCSVLQKLAFFALTIVFPRHIECLNYKPHFTQSPLIKSLLENSPPGTTVTKLSNFAQDDEGDVMTYSIDTVGKTYCNVDPTTGLITLSKSLDREIKDLVSFTAYAEDNYQGGGETRRAPVLVFIYVMDVNDWAPEFQGTPYHATVKENATNGDLVLTVKATDKDDSSNAEITYQFKSGSQIPQFSLDGNSGAIKVAGQLDYETTTRYTLSVVAKDKGDTPLSSETRVIIDIQDVSDNAPVFNPSSYEKRVDENLPLDTVVLGVAASDGDKGVNSPIEYEIYSGNNDGMFKINKVTGVITVNGTLDREESSMFSLKVKAYEVPMPSTFSLADVVIQLNDVNDFRPVFSNKSYTFTIDEDKPKGFIISQQLTATDSDASVTNHAFQYSLSGDSSKFAVNSLNGQLTVNANLDYETQAKFVFTILAKETLSSEKFSGNATVTIYLNNVNDNSPVFNQTSYLFQSVENYPIGTYVGMVKASDSDKGVFGDVTYALSSASSFFLINSTTGVISLKNVPDYEEAQSHEFQVVATDGGGSNAKSASSNVRVDILDVNDNDPSFTNLPTKINVLENRAAGTIFTVKATDNDAGANGEVHLKLLNSSAPEFFFNESTGILNTTGPLDYEAPKKNFILRFQASDNGQMKRSVTQTLEISVQDENDHVPQFDQKIYNATIMENAKIGALVINLNATDLDSGLNSKITYQIVSGNERNTFQLSASSGEIKTQDLLDRETVDTYQLQIRASDHGSPSLSNTTTVIIKIEDFNDHFPTFSQSSFAVNINESAPIGDTVILLQATDGDICQNGRVSYFIVSGNEQGMFKLDNATGELTIAKKLDWEKKSTYILNVKAEDHGSKTNSRTAFVTIDVADNNDNSPAFTESVYSFQIYENSPIGRSVGRVTAVDADGKLFPNLNGVVKYSITAGNSQGQFKIDKDVGTISTNKTIDREKMPFYNITVTAKDGGIPQNSASINVAIRVLDENDNPPSFERNNYTLRVSENVTVGTTIALIKAVDVDDGINSQLSYAITSGNSGGVFAIKQNGDLTISNKIDREATFEYHLKVTARDSGSPQLTGTTGVHVIITDTNDNKPVFIGTPYNAVMLEEQPAGILVLQVQAKDADQGRNGLVTYSIVEVIPSNVFKINATTGNITAVSVIDREVHSMFTLNISAKDNGEEQLVSFATMTVSVGDINDNSPVLANLPNRTSISEDASGGSTVFDIVAYDKDAGENARLSYTIVSGDFGKFTMNNGKVVTSSTLDREDKSYFMITVNVTDNGVPPQKVSSTLVIVITDVNDNPPLFVPNPILNSALYVKTIREDQANANVTVFDVNATDADSGINGQISYSISSGNEGGFFQIDPLTGEIKFAREIDREGSGMNLNLAGFGVFSLNIKATDQAESNTKFATTSVTILISDVNDNRPIFSNTAYFAGISEGADVSSTVITVSASDKDLGLNARIKYSIVGGNINGDFAILNQYAGTISVAKLLNAEQTALYNLTVIAEDDGSLNGGVSLNSTVVVQIKVGDVNDNDPVFNQSDYSASIKENLTKRQRVIRVFASDQDQGTNGEIWYQITSGNTDNAFEIDNKTGDVFAIATIDRERISKYTLTIKAEDKGLPSSRKSAVDLTINIEDVNDNPTKFKSNVYVGHVVENSPAGTQISLSQSLAFADADEISSSISLSLYEPGFEKFNINSTSYSIKTSNNATFDRETTPIYYLKIIARDIDGLSSESTLIVIVDDVNDNNPIFNDSYSVVNISEDASIGQSLITLTAYDKDQGINAQLSYTVQGGDDKFIFNQTSGMLQLNQKLDREKQSFYRLEIIASDQGTPSLNGKAIVDVYVLDIIDSAPYFVPSVVDLSINETFPTNTVFYRLNAKDDDENDTITYKATSSLYNTVQINSISGELKLLKNFDRENTSSFQMTFQAIDKKGLSSAPSALTLRIKVLDANDNAPKFLQSFYTNDVVENTPDGTIVMSVVASDPDEGQNAKITYSIIENVSDLLRIDPEKGFVSKYGVWKTSSGGVLNFTIMARDNGNPQQFSTVQSRIRWIAVNSLNPRFNKSLYSVQISEDAAPGSEVIQLIAYKRGQVEPVTFSMTGGQDHFNIDSSLGIIRVSEALDREQQERFAITVTATDNQVPPQNGVTSVTISLLDVNDVPPKFSSSIYQFSISEDSGINSLIGDVVATDDDSGNNSRLAYSITAGNERNWFNIESSNGTIRTIHLIDREVQEVFQLTITARDHGLKPLESSATVVITILDVNDNRPRFNKSIYNISVNENLALDSEVLSLPTEDGDKGPNGTVVYSIVSGNELGNFHIGRTTGLIRIAKILDHETTHDFNLTILAMDNGGPSVLSSVAAVFIKVLDVNDNKLRFLSSSYSFSVNENALVGEQIGQVSAIDTDTSYSTVYYGIQGNGTGSVFRISETNGTIFLSQKVDREHVASYDFNVEAYNKDHHGNASLKSFAGVTIQIVDVNDNAPQFTSPNCCNVSLFENANIGDVILRIGAIDADAGSNKKISYSIIAGDDNGEFKIDSTTGDLKLMKSLDHERAAHYSLIVNAKDEGIPMMSSNATVRISVLDVNDMAPVFKPLNLTTVSENAAVGTVVVKVIADDRDMGANGEVFYEIMSGNDDNAFTLGTSNGELSVAKKLDFERVQTYKLRIMARDRGIPFLSSFTTLTINVTNINDNAPTFLQGTVDVSIVENMPSGSIVATIVAPDADKDPVYYYIQDGNKNVFSLDENSGVLTTKKILDREESQIYTLTIEATNTKKPIALARSRRVAASFSTQKVVIRIEDQNDNAPKFTQKEYRAGVSENAKYATSIIQVVAIDLDSGNNSNIAYTILSGKSNGLFVLERKTGWIKSAQLFTGKVGQNFELTVVAKDNDGIIPCKNDTTVVKIFVLTDNQRVVLTMNVDPQTVRDNKEEFIRVLQNITSFKINIDDIQYSTKDGEYDRSSTDLTFHAVDRNTNEIQEKDVVIQAIARNQAKYQEFFTKWKVQSVKAVVVPTSAPRQDDTQTILIAVAAALFLIILGFVFALCYLRRKQRRKLKAATASAINSDATVEREHMQQLNSIVKGSVSSGKALNRASEKFYPMWIEPKDENFDSVRPLLASFRIKCSSASYYEENKSMNTVSNTRTLTTEIVRMSDPYIGETDVDYYADGDDFYGSEDMSDMFDSQTDDDIDRSSGAHCNPIAAQILSKEELLLRASLQPMGTLELDEINVTSI